MADVGVRELKAHLSEYLDRVARGEIIRVTDRGHPKAILAPVPGASRLEEGITAGWIRPAKRGPRGPWSRSIPSRPVSEVLTEDRDE